MKPQRLKAYMELVGAESFMLRFITSNTSLSFIGPPDKKRKNLGLPSSSSDNDIITVDLFGDRDRYSERLVFGDVAVFAHNIGTV